VGLVLHFETWNEIGHQVAKPVPSEKAATLADAIDAFRAAHPEWVVTVDVDGVVIRDSTVTPRDERFSAFSVEDESLFHAFARAQALIDPEIPTDQGIAFMGPANVNAEYPPIDEFASQRRVSISLRAKTLEQILNSLAAIDPGTGSAGGPARQRRITLHARNRDFEGLLIALAATDPGTTWVLVRHADREGQYDELIVRYSDGTLGEHRDRLPIVEPERLRARLEARWKAAAEARMQAERPSEPVADRPVDHRAVEAAARGEIRELLAYLRASGVPVGVVVRRETADRVLGGGSPELDPESSTVRLAEVLSTIQRSANLGFSAQIDEFGCVLVERHLRPRWDRYESFEAFDVPLRAAFLSAQRRIDPTIPAEVGGGAASVLSGLEEPDWERILDPWPIRLSVGRASFPQLLNAIAAEAPGTGWILVRHASTSGDFDTLTVELWNATSVEFRYPLPLPRRGR
jgi:hypothetical protein